MVLQSSMGQFKLDVRYGDRNTLPYYNGALDSGLLGRVGVANEATAGKVYTIANNGALTVGLVTDTTLKAVPYFGWSGMDANNYPDVQRDRGMPGYLDKPDTGIGGPGSPGWPGIALRGEGDNIAGGFATIQHIAAAELSTTAFVLDETNNAFNALIGDTTVVAADYAPGAALTVISAGDVDAARGLLIPVTTAEHGTLANAIVVGYVAPAGAFVGPEGYQTLAFTPAFVPNTAAAEITAGSPNTIAAAAPAAPLA